MEEKYSRFLEEVGKFVPKNALYTDEIRRFAWGTDAGFYRLCLLYTSDAADE